MNQNDNVSNEESKTMNRWTSMVKKIVVASLFIGIACNCMSSLAPRSNTNQRQLEAAKPLTMNEQLKAYREKEERRYKSLISEQEQTQQEKNAELRKANDQRLERAKEQRSQNDAQQARIDRGAHATQPEKRSKISKDQEAEKEESLARSSFLSDLQKDIHEVESKGDEAKATALRLIQAHAKNWSITPAESKLMSTLIRRYVEGHINDAEFLRQMGQKRSVPNAKVKSAGNKNVVMQVFVFMVALFFMT